MNIKILSLRKTSDATVGLLEQEYLKRFRKYATVTLIDIKRSKMKGTSKRAVQDESKKISSHLSTEVYTVLLSEKGKTFTSGAFAQFIKSKIHSGTRTITFIIGGPTGVGEELAQRADFKLSLSPMTFPHKLTRLLLIEALYRSFDILNGGPYHK
ncbi:MAG: 23S rRNA (pseudouridine(1915)-N(3))-methyltransferase RlmH [Candidatus Omnitrophica bacterium]|nr:23S rRNA (pseudouridine(1915)-N(3))-methyltransferase RlmH [Candidatus Omnitrophota bacterium]